MRVTKNKLKEKERKNTALINIFISNEINMLIEQFFGLLNYPLQNGYFPHSQTHMTFVDQRKRNKGEEEKRELKKKHNKTELY